MATRKDGSARPDACRSPQEMSYEEALRELESIIERLEQGDIALQESLQEHRRGTELLKRCRGILDAAEQEIEKLTAEEAPDT